MKEIKRPLVSVIIPVYNVERYLKECIDSVIKQTYNNIEIICVNDGSTDNCLNILRRYAEQDDRIKVVSTDNKGLPAARNIGLKIAHGEYIMFVDSDDVVNCRMVEIMLSIIQRNDLQLVCCDYTRDLQAFRKITAEYDNENLALIDKTKAMKSINDLKGERYQVVWGKLFDASLFHGILFNEDLCYSEDISLMSRIYYRLDRIGIYDCQLYYWRKHKNQATAKLGIDHIDTVRESFIEFEYFKDKNEVQIAF